MIESIFKAVKINGEIYMINQMHESITHGELMEEVFDILGETTETFTGCIKFGYWYSELDEFGMPYGFVSVERAWNKKI